MSVLVRVRLVGSRHMDVNVAVPPCVTHTCHPAFVPARSLLPSAPAGVPGLPCRPPQVLLHGDRMLTWCFERVAVFIKTGVCVCAPQPRQRPMQMLPVLVCLLELWMLSCSNFATVPAFMRLRIHLLWYMMHWCAVAGCEVVRELLVQARAAAKAIGPWLDKHIGLATVEHLRGMKDAQWLTMLEADPALNLTTAQRYLLVNRFNRMFGATRESARSPRPVVVARAHRVMCMPTLRLAC